jgi:hypothetical protein
MTKPDTTNRLTVSVKKRGAAFQGLVKGGRHCIWESPLTATVERARQLANEHAELICSSGQ